MLTCTDHSYRSWMIWVRVKMTDMNARLYQSHSYAFVSIILIRVHIIMNDANASYMSKKYDWLIWMRVPCEGYECIKSLWVHQISILAIWVHQISILDTRILSASISFIWKIRVWVHQISILETGYECIKSLFWGIWVHQISILAHAYLSYEWYECAWTWLI